MEDTGTRRFWTCSVLSWERPWMLLKILYPLVDQLFDNGKSTISWYISIVLIVWKGDFLCYKLRILLYLIAKLGKFFFHAGWRMVSFFFSIFLAFVVSLGEDSWIQSGWQKFLPLWKKTFERLFFWKKNPHIQWSNQVTQPLLFQMSEGFYHPNDDSSRSWENIYAPVPPVPQRATALPNAKGHFGRNWSWHS